MQHLLVFLVAWLATYALAIAGSVPRLVVVLCFDQLRADRLEVYRPWLGQNGFVRLMRQGVRARTCEFDYATTVTAAGHATISTGCNPWRHGIVDNEFVIAGRVLSATQDTLLEQPSPRLLLVPTFSDALKRRFPQSKVWSLSHKDRGAIFLGGRRADGVLWLEPGQGLTSSTYYPPLPQWIVSFNREHPPQSFIDTVWNVPLRTGAPPDSVEEEGTFPGGTCYFPHRIPLDTNAKQFWYAFMLSPASARWLFAAAVECIQSEQLGADTIPDFLALSISTTDYVGHMFGHDSREYMEVLIEADRLLAEFLNMLDSTVGRQHYLLVLTSDHGAASIPELERRRGLPAGRIRTEELMTAVNSWFTQHYPHVAGHNGTRLIEHFLPPWLWLSRHAVDAAGVSVEQLSAQLAQWLTSVPGIGIALSRTEIEAGTSCVDTSLLRRIRNSYYPERCGDVVVYPAPHWIFGSTPAQHGTPYDYDRSVPLVWFGAGLLPEVLEHSCTPSDIVATLCAVVGITLEPLDGSALPLTFRR